MGTRVYDEFQLWATRPHINQARKDMKERWVFAVGSMLFLLAAIWVLDIRVGGIRLAAGMILLLASLGAWEAGHHQ